MCEGKGQLTLASIEFVVLDISTFSSTLFLLVSSTHHTTAYQLISLLFVALLTATHIFAHYWSYHRQTLLAHKLTDIT